MAYSCSSKYKKTGQFSMNYQKDKDKRTFHLKSDNQVAFQHNKTRTHKKQRQNYIFPF